MAEQLGVEEETITEASSFKEDLAADSLDLFDQPLGISSYELSKLIPEEFRGSMPTIEEIEAELNE